MFDDEKNENVQSEKKQEYERNEMNAKTKMTYKYPKQGEFRFPVIPDQQVNDQRSVRENRAERPKQRRSETPDNQKKESPNEKRSQPKKRVEHKQELPETSSIPFTPTDVPSPIYGYQNRQLTVGLEKLENTVVPNKQQETRALDDAEWQELRKRLRSRVTEDKERTSRSAIQKQFEKPLNKETPAEETKNENSTFSEKLVNEEAAAIETPLPIKENSANQEDEDQNENSTDTSQEQAVEKEYEEQEGWTEILNDQDEDTNDRGFKEEESSIQAYEGLTLAEDEEESMIKEGNEERKEEVVLPEEQLDEEDHSLMAEQSFTQQDESPAQRDDEQERMTIDDHKEEESMEEKTSKREEYEDNSRQPDAKDLTPSLKEEASNPAPDSVSEDDNDTPKEPVKENTVLQENKKPQKTQTKDRSQKRTVPFNVIMTPRDKRSRDRNPAPRHEESNKRVEKEQSTHVEERSTTPVKKETYQTPLHLLEDPIRNTDGDDQWITDQMELLETTLRHFHVRAKVVNAMKGPTVTRFEVQPEPGVKVSKITNLSDDIKLSMAARDIRIEAPIPGKQAVGIEVPNQIPQMVGLQEIFESEAFQADSSPLSVGLGLDIGGDSIVTNLKKMPHGLIAGATGSGKSVCINTILISLLYKAHHEDVKFLLIDPKMVELAPYNDLPHLVSPVITDVKAATTALKWAVKEMEERYEKFVQEGVRDVERYNDKMLKSGRRDEKMPYMVIVIDELADLMMVSPQDVEDSICRI
ncbi:hypothetical protein LD39_15905, partial [Halobacillus sp. BBL2006]